MRTFLVVSFGTVVAVVTAAALLVVALGLALEDYGAAGSGAALWGLFAVLVGLGWATWWLARSVIGLVGGGR